MADTCEGCGAWVAVEFVKILLTNGALTLCRQCLDEFNAKNPELPKLRAERDKALAEAAALREASSRVLRWWDGREGGVCDSMGALRAALAAWEQAKAANKENVNG